MESDLIDRNNAINVLEILSDKMTPSGKSVMAQAIAVLKDLEPSKQNYEWCTRGEHPCKEYDQENHCCHRWSSFIRETLKDMRICRCNECRYSEPVDDLEDGYRCNCPEHRNRSVIWFGGDFCSYGERND